MHPGQKNDYKKDPMDVKEKNTAGQPRVQYVSFEQLLEKDGYLVYTNVGRSMMPLLRQRRDIIEIRKKQPGRCKKYDVVLYKRGDKYILHRILKLLPEGYVIAGDNNAFLETDITDEKILGVMTRVIRNGRSISVDNKWYRLYVHLWCDCYPLRILLFRLRQKARSKLSKVYRTVFKRR